MENIRQITQWCILAPLSFAILGFSIIKLISQDWAIGVYSTFIFILIGRVGAGLWPEKSARELSKGDFSERKETPNHMNEFDQALIEINRDHDSSKIVGKTLMSVGLVLVIFSTGLSLLSGHKLVFSILIGVATWFVSLLLMFFVVGVAGIIVRWRDK